MFLYLTLFFVLPSFRLFHRQKMSIIFSLSSNYLFNRISKISFWVRLLWCLKVEVVVTHPCCHPALIAHIVQRFQVILGVSMQIWCHGHSVSEHFFLNHSTYTFYLNCFLIFLSIFSRQALMSLRGWYT